MKVARFDTRLPESQKELFERAAHLGGYRTLTEFVIVSAQSKAEEIIEKHSAIFKSERDRKVFFDAIMNPPAPNKHLKAAMKEYRQLKAKK